MHTWLTEELFKKYSKTLSPDDEEYRPAATVVEETKEVKEDPLCSDERLCS